MIEALAPIGHVTVRRMFGGIGLYLDGVIFAILGLDDLWFKTDAESDAIWDEISPERFTVTMRGKLASMNYRRAPEDAHDDPDALIPTHCSHWRLDGGAEGPPRAGGGHPHTFRLQRLAAGVAETGPRG